MKWNDIKDSTEFAEALSLFASLVAAVIALRDAQKDEKKEESEEQKRIVPPETDLLLKSVDKTRFGKLIQQSILPGNRMVFALAFVVSVQMLILLFIAWKVL